MSKQALPDEARGVVIARFSPDWRVKLDDETEVTFAQPSCSDTPVVGMHVIVWQLRQRLDGVWAHRAELDEAYRDEYEGLLCKAFEQDAVDKANGARRSPQRPLVAGQFRGIVEPIDEKKCAVRLEDGRLARCYTTNKFMVEPGVDVIVRRTEEQRGELWVAEMELDEEHRESYERIYGRMRYERDREFREQARKEAAAARQASASLPEEAKGTVIVHSDDRSGILQLEDGTRVGFNVISYSGFEMLAGLKVRVRRLKRLVDGTLMSDHIELDEVHCVHNDEVYKAFQEERARPIRERMQRGAERKRLRNIPYNEALEAAILDRPGDLGAWDELQTWLSKQGDIRAELMAVDRSLLQAEADHLPAAEVDLLRGARDLLLARHAEFLLGELADPACGVNLTWRLGLIQSATLVATDAMESMSERLNALLCLPTARLVQKITLGQPGSKDNDGYVDAIQALLAPGPNALESLTLGDFKPDGKAIAQAKIGDVSPLGNRFPRLTTLVVQGSQIQLDPTAFPRLQRLYVRTTALARSTLRALVAGPWPYLEELVVWLGTPPPEPADRKGRLNNLPTMEDLAPLLDGSHLPALKHLGLANTKLTNDICRALPTSGILPKLKRLDLSLGTMTDGAAAAIAAAAKAFGHLDVLDAHKNLLTPTGQAYLHEAVSDARVDEQRPGYGEGRREIGVSYDQASL